MPDSPPGNDWLPYRHAPPSLSPHDIIELWREGWVSIWSGRYCDINPMMNACGLWWRTVKRQEERRAATVLRLVTKEDKGDENEN